jgi:chromosome segregation ATPase
MNGNEPATKADLQLLRVDLEQLRSETTHQHNDLVERIDDLKTELLSAFYAFAKIDQKRIAHVEGDNAALNSRIATIEERLLTVEQKLNLPPAA